MWMKLWSLCALTSLAVYIAVTWFIFRSEEPISDVVALSVIFALGITLAMICVGLNSDRSVNGVRIGYALLAAILAFIGAFNGVGGEATTGGLANLLVFVVIVLVGLAASEFWVSNEEWAEVDKIASAEVVHKRQVWIVLFSIMAPIFSFVTWLAGSALWLIFGFPVVMFLGLFIATAILQGELVADKEAKEKALLLQGELDAEQEIKKKKEGEKAQKRAAPKKKPARAAQPKKTVGGSREHA